MGASPPVKLKFVEFPVSLEDPPGVVVSDRVISYMSLLLWGIIITENERKMMPDIVLTGLKDTTPPVVVRFTSSAVKLKVLCGPVLKL